MLSIFNSDSLKKAIFKHIRTLSNFYFVCFKYIMQNHNNNMMPNFNSMNQSNQNFNNFPSYGNPFGGFNAVTPSTLQSMNSGMNNFNKSYTENNTIIEKQDFRNKNNVMYNNLGEKLLSEHIAEYQIFIDSNDRSLGSYPNPFKYTVTFGGASRTTTRVNGDNVTYNGAPDPVINRSFKNVKYVKFDYIILPNTNKLIYDSGTYTVDTTSGNYFINSNKYLILRITELKSDKVLSTNNNLSNCSFMLYPDRTMGNQYQLWTASHGSRVSLSSDLSNLNRLSFELLDSDGNLIKVLDNSDRTVDFNLINTSSNEDLVTSLKSMNKKMGNGISMLIGVAENELNTMASY
jgi:hypothetical protein